VWATGAAAQGNVTVSHGLTLLDQLKYGPDYKHFEYVNPDAPKGGAIRMHTIGAFDTFNPFVIKGQPAAGLGWLFETLMTSPLDDDSAEYGLIAETVEVPDDISYVIYNLRAAARFHDGTPITAADVVWSFETLKTKGAPQYRFYYANVAKAEALSPRKVKFSFSGPPNRELPQIVGQLPVLSKKYWESRDFEKTTLEPPLGSGPYKIAAFEPGRYVVYERVKDYWGKDIPPQRGQNNFDTVRIDYYRDQTVALEAFKAHQYDYRMESSAKDWATGYDFPGLRSGLTIKAEVPNQRPTGMQAFAFNIRRDKFRDPRVREALGYAFDFEWSNQTLFFGQYTRTESFFSNTELAAKGLPSPDELKLLEPLRGKIPEEVFTKAYAAPKSDGSGSNRENLRRAAELLRAAGWQVKNNKLVDPKTGEPLEIEFLLDNPQFERVVSPFVQNLQRLGITGRIRTVDPAQYENRTRDFDFDVVIVTVRQSMSPGNEQRDFWSSAAAERPGSRNIIGIKNPAVDALIDKIVEAHDRKTLVTAVHALDRVLLWNHYVIPQWHVRNDRIAYWNKFGQPKITPKNGVALFSWWVDPDKEAALNRGEAQLKENK
jgi:microcin C transport system substrate-binding protein